MPESKGASENFVKLKIAESERQERDVSDTKYAPMFVKTILFGLIGSIALAVFFGVADLVINKFVSKFDTTTTIEPPQVPIEIQQQTRYD